MKSIAIALLAAFAVVAVAPSHSYADANAAISAVSTTRLKTKDAKGNQPQQAPVVTSRSNKKGGPVKQQTHNGGVAVGDVNGDGKQAAPVNTSRSNKKHGISDQAAQGNLSGKR